VASEFGDPILSWIEIREVTDTRHVDFLETIVDKGEASVIALAQEIQADLILLDDLAARKLAKRLGLRI
jgi:predicted nucleic acid-binding protein